eukprot:TRINITY_DN49678_c0_g1_i1.p1 TRINITY_DN49678_c0_g1~~TRINITY_DN49678_c0_g1_i1.p1  ORF type:complete len:146 (-),score=20.53 TRINITY_DN49678_c0_g1_i1:12-449(-)
MGVQESMCCQLPGENRHPVCCKQPCGNEIDAGAQKMQVSALHTLQEDQVDRWSGPPADHPLPVCQQQTPHGCAEMSQSAGCSPVTVARAPNDYLADSQDGMVISPAVMVRGHSKMSGWLEEFEEDQVETDVTDSRPKTTQSAYRR